MLLILYWYSPGKANKSKGTLCCALYKHNIVDSDCPDEITVSVIYTDDRVIDIEYYDSPSRSIDTGWTYISPILIDGEILQISNMKEGISDNPTNPKPQAPLNTY